MKRALKHLARRLGYEIQPIQQTPLLPRKLENLLPMLTALQLRGFKPNTCLDVGAHKGGWSRQAKRIFPSMSCYLIEPLAEMQSYLENFVQEFPDSKYLLVGAGATDTALPFEIRHDLTGSSFLQASTTASAHEQRTTQVRTIDSLLLDNQFDVPELVKLDVQGYELQALQGATQLFGKTEVFILEVSFFEYMPSMPLIDDVIRFMSERDYVIYDIVALVRRPYDGALGQADLCFVKRDGFLRASNRWG